MPSLPRAEPAATAERLAARIHDSGNLGLTSAQLARATGTAPAVVAVALERLRRDRRIARVGHGLWLDATLLADPTRGAGYTAPSEFLDRFAREHRIAPSTYTGDLQFRPNTEEPVHRWWPYVQGFSAGFVRTVLDRHGIGVGATVLDPFAGSGTVTVAARTAGAASLGIELMPISAFVARAKHRWEADPRALRRESRRLLDAAERGPLAPLPFLRETTRQFAPGPLSTLRRLRAALPGPGADDAVDQLLRLAFARILVDSSRMRRSPCLGYGPKPPVPGAAPRRFYAAAVERMAEDLERLQRPGTPPGPPGTILREDARRARLPPGTVDLAVTSPPYVNGMDYVMNYKLELAWLELARSYDDLRALKDTMVACDNLPKTAALRGWSDGALGADPWMRGILAAMRTNLAAKSGYRRTDMDAVVASYFADLRPAIAGVYEALRPGGRFVVVNGDSFLAGVYVPGDLIFGRIARAEGFEVERFEDARVRRSGQRRDIRLRESILTLRKPTDA